LNKVRTVIAVKAIPAVPPVVSRVKALLVRSSLHIRFTLAYPDFWIFFEIRISGCFVRIFYSFTSALPSVEQTDSCDMKQFVLLSVFDTLSCMYDCIRCTSTTAGFMRHFLAIQVTSKANDQINLLI